MNHPSHSHREDFDQILERLCATAEEGGSTGTRARRAGASFDHELRRILEGVTGARALSTSPGNVRTTYGGASGSRSITVRYMDENDGQATFTLRVNGAAVGSWTANVDDHTWKTRTFTGVSLASGVEIRVESARQSGEHARIDYLEIGN